MTLIRGKCRVSPAMRALSYDQAIRSLTDRWYFQVFCIPVVTRRQSNHTERVLKGIDRLLERPVIMAKAGKHEAPVRDHTFPEQFLLHQGPHTNEPMLIGLSENKIHAERRAR